MLRLNFLEWALTFSNIQHLMLRGKKLALIAKAPLRRQRPATPHHRLKVWVQEQGPVPFQYPSPNILEKGAGGDRQAELDA